MGSVIPMVVIVRGARRDKWASHHVANREGRVVPFVACTSSPAVGIAVLVLGDAPHQMLVIAYGAWLLSMALAVVLVDWSRVELGDHTRAQVVWGSVAGGAVGCGGYFVLISVLD